MAMNVPYRNKKTGECYILYAYATNATNKRDGEELCLYFKWTEKDQCPWNTYARNKEEFMEKFEQIERSELDTMVIKRFGEDFHSSGGALTLNPSEVSDVNRIGGPYTRSHPDGWTITGVIHEDYYEWVNEFKAEHPHYGVIYGDFEDKVTASSEEAFQHFYENHKPEEWDYQDI